MTLFVLIHGAGDGGWYWHLVEEELRGLVYSLTPRIEEGHMAWWKRPVTLGIAVLVVSAILNVIFW